MNLGGKPVWRPTCGYTLLEWWFFVFVLFFSVASTIFKIDRLPYPPIFQGELVFH